MDGTVNKRWLLVVTSDVFRVIPLSMSKSRERGFEICGGISSHWLTLVGNVVDSDASAD